MELVSEDPSISFVDGKLVEVPPPDVKLRCVVGKIGDAALRMEIVGSPNEIPPVQKEVQAEIDKAEGKSWPLVPVERMAFYEIAKKSYCVIATGERRFYGCFMFTKGVIPPETKY